MYTSTLTSAIGMDITIGSSTTELTGGEGTAFTSFQRLRPGTLIVNRYEIRRHLGTGGYGIVYLAFDRFLGKEIAIKTLRPDRQSPAARLRFQREVKVAREISGRNLVRVFDIDSQGELWYLTMEVVDGGSLRDRLRDGPLPVDEAVAIAVGIANGLAELHSASAIHRDLKPENVLLSAGGQPKLADFGLTRLLDQERAQGPTVTGAIVGTTDYMSPEQALGGDVDARGDLYALGVVLFEMLTGHVPARNRQQPPDVRAQRRDAPLWLSLLVTRLLEFEPDRRHASAEIVVRILRRRRLDVRALFTPIRAIAFLVLLLVVAAAIVLAFSQRPMHFARLSEAGETEIAAIGTSGDVLWHRDHVQARTAARYALVRLEPKARPAIATILLRPHDYSPQYRQILSFLDPDTGRVLRQAVLPSAAEEFTRWPDHYDVSSLYAADFNDDGVDEVVISYQQIPESGTFVVLYEPKLDRARIVFVGMGGYRFMGAEDVDGDGRRDLFVVGIDNGVNWYNACAAVRIAPWIGETRMGETASHTRLLVYSPDMANLNDEDLLWYTFLPRGLTVDAASALQWDKARRRITIPYSNRPPVIVTFSGFLASDLSSTPAKRRDAFRRTAWKHYCESVRVLAAGLNAEAVRESERALAAATNSSDSILMEVMQVALAKTLVTVGREDEGSVIFYRLAVSSENSSEIAYDAGRAFHLHGRLDQAVSWYMRGISTGGRVGDGKSKHEYIQAIVFALAEKKAWNDAIAHIDQFRIAYVTSDYDWVAMYREFVRWRMGGLPRTDTIRIFDHTTDLGHYWALEFRNAHGEDPNELLRLTQEQIDLRAETRAALWSLKADLLARLGNDKEAAGAARQAWELGQADATWNVIARGHLPLIRERLIRYAGAH